MEKENVSSEEDVSALTNLLTTKQAAEYLELSRQRIQQLRLGQEIKAIKIGVWMYVKEDLDRYLEEKRKPFRQRYFKSTE